MPFYKRTWVLVVAGLFIAITAINAIGGDEKESANEAASTSAAATTTAAPTTPAPTTPAPLAAVSPVPTTAATTSAAPVVDFVMPNLVGIDLQTAQNTVQTNGVFFSVSHDLLGSRNQALDSNWIVCDQNVAPGQRVTGDVEGAIDFGVVKRNEVCP
ncbi:hypothetical protein [Blastococcus sp. LR1]|uniref:hypothetical protein n=1 Tax=Blastococcus sp. LR1 TaxID=2877000 RepID=UPI001CCA9095|nr:hypothetical protein [Blastococcus sp. LR1]MCA0146775.1 hypothetical protein [Blastococcus sp. LR1]